MRVLCASATSHPLKPVVFLSNMNSSLLSPIEMCFPGVDFSPGTIRNAGHVTNLPEDPLSLNIDYFEDFSCLKKKHCFETEVKVSNETLFVQVN